MISTTFPKLKLREMDCIVPNSTVSLELQIIRIAVAHLLNSFQTPDLTIVAKLFSDDIYKNGWFVSSCDIVTINDKNIL